ncbi:MAG TPA: hypothetical protein VF897_04450 [Roseiflexaceae bacterium]
MVIASTRAHRQKRDVVGLGRRAVVGCQRRRQVVAQLLRRGVRALAHGGVQAIEPYDARTYRLMSMDRVSLNTTRGRVVGQLVLGDFQRHYLYDTSWKIGGAELIRRADVLCRSWVTASKEQIQAARF